MSATAGTIFHGTRTPLTVWFTAAFHLVSSYGGLSAVQLQREMRLGSYQTAWAMLHRLRSVMVRHGRDRLDGLVAVGESVVERSRRDRGAHDPISEVRIAMAVELHSSGTLGGARLGVLNGTSALDRCQFLLDNIKCGSTVVIDQASYVAAARGLYTVRPGAEVTTPGSPVRTAPQIVDRVRTPVIRWLLDAARSSVSAEHLQSYLDEWAFRFNERHSNRGQLFHRLMSQSVDSGPIVYRDLRKVGRRSPLPRQRGTAPASATGRCLDVPWRRDNSLSL